MDWSIKYSSILGDAVNYVKGKPQSNKMLTSAPVAASSMNTGSKSPLTNPLDDRSDHNHKGIVLHDWRTEMDKKNLINQNKIIVKQSLLENQKRILTSCPVTQLTRRELKMSKLILLKDDSKYYCPIDGCNQYKTKEDACCICSTVCLLAAYPFCSSC